MTARVVLLSLVFLFPAGEVGLALFRRSPSWSARQVDRGSLRVLWAVVLCCAVVAIASQSLSSLRLPGPRRVLDGAAAALLALGLAVRWTAVLTLGRFFTVDIAIHEGHVLVCRGLYRHLRHPGYTGLLLALAGLGVFFGNWLAVGVLTLPVAAALLARIRREEAALLEGLGTPYAEYCARTKRLLPGIY